MRKNKSKNASRHYPELHRYPDSPFWIFRKYSKEKHREFAKSTKIEATEKNAASAYKKGKELFDEWLGTYLPSGRQVLMRDLLRSILASKLSRKGGQRGATYRSARNQIMNHLIPAFGHLRPEQITEQKWKLYDRTERARRTALFNTRKYLAEALRLAFQHGMIRRIPELVLNDPDPEPPKYIDWQTTRKILRHPSVRYSKYFFYLLRRQGPRPEEALQYEWPMFHWEQGENGYLRIPGGITKTGRSREIPINSRVSRVFRWLHGLAKDHRVFPSRYIPNQRQTNYRKGWESACADLGLDFDPYNARDSFITDCIRRGDKLTFIAKYVDSSATQIEKRYAVAVEQEMTGVAG